MASFTTTHAVQVFYELWKVSVFTFCRLFLGDEDAAGESASRAFLSYIRKGNPLDSGELPPQLVGEAIAAVKDRCATAPKANGGCRTLAEAILVLPCEQRAVFILRSVLGCGVELISVVIRMPVEQVRKVYLAALLRLRELLPRSFFEERSI